MGRGNNFGLKTRDLAKAGRFAANAAAKRGDLGYQTAADLGDRWGRFARFCHDQGIRRMEQITRETVLAYGHQLAQGERALAPSTAQNAISAVNSVMRLATQGRWARVGAVADCQLAQRSAVREHAPTLDRQPLEAAAEQLREAGHDRGAAVLELAREFGLRSKEASLLDARRAVDQARDRGEIVVSDGTKGGRARVVPVTPAQQVTLERAAQAQQNARSLIPADQSWVAWRHGGLRDAREALQAQGIPRIHDLRAAYASERYAQLTGQPIPLHGGQADRHTDQVARLQVAQELGHNRLEVVAAYIGGRAR